VVRAALSPETESNWASNWGAELFSRRRHLLQSTRAPIVGFSQWEHVMQLLALVLIRSDRRPNRSRKPPFTGKDFDFSEPAIDTHSSIAGAGTKVKI